MGAPANTPDPPQTSWPERLAPWQLLVVALLIAELCTMVVTVGCSLAFRGEIAIDYLITGAIACGLVATLIIFLVFRWTQRLARARERIEATEHERDALQAQLLRSHKLEAVGQLAGGVAHDFNNLLGGILGNVYYLQSGPPDAMEREELDEVLGDIQAAAERGAKLATQLLAFARREPGEVARVSAADVIDTMMRLHRRIFDRSIRIATQAPGELQVMANRAQLEQVLMNLCINARDAMPEGGRLTMSARALAIADAATVPDGDYVEFEVADTGCGMDPETVQRAFEPFYTTGGPGDGSGLGMSVAYGIVRGHGGSFELDSTPGEGSSVRFVLPAAPAPELDPSPQPEPVADRRDGPLQVLLVDDEPLVLKATTRLLDNAGFAVTAAPSGEDALEHARRDACAIDLVVLDLVMPGMDGEATFRALRDAGVDSPVLLVSGYDSGQRVERCLAAGAGAFLHKPLHPEELVRVLHRLHQGRAEPTPRG